VKVNGERVFSGLLTVTNEKGEIRVCNLVTTKAHLQFEDTLKTMSELLDLYGHKQPQLFYTNNMADKPFLESSFHELCKDVVLIERHGDLKPFILPSEIQICI